MISKEVDNDVFVVSNNNESQVPPKILRFRVTLHITFHV